MRRRLCFASWRLKSGGAKEAASAAMSLSSASAHSAPRAEGAASTSKAAREARSGWRRIAAGLYGSPVASEDLQERQAQDHAGLTSVSARHGRAGVEAHERGPRPRHLAREAGAAEVSPVETRGAVPH